MKPFSCLSRKPAGRGRKRSIRLVLEAVESRLLPAALIEPPSIVSHNGVLQATLTHTEGDTTIDGQTVGGAMTYNGVYAGVTLMAQPGDRLDLTVVNELLTLTSNLHSHGLHVSPIGNGDNVFLQVQPGDSNAYQIQVPENHPQGLYWYHPHIHGTVDLQIQKGLSGMLVIGRADGGAPELDGFEQSLLGLKTLTTPSASGYLPLLDGLNTTANYSINGQIAPSKSIAPGEVQVWNVANLSRDSVFRLQLDGHKLHVVAQDGNPLTRPIEVDFIDVGPANRVSFLVQASTTPGDYTFRTLGFMDGDRQFAAESLMTVEVAGEPVAHTIPTSLTPPANLFEDLRNSHVAAERTIRFEEDADAVVFAINGETFPNVPIITARLNTVEEWTLINDTYQIHPFHIHQNGFQVISVNGALLAVDGSPLTVFPVAHYVEGFSTAVPAGSPPQSQQYIGGGLIDTVSIPAKDPTTGEPGRVVIRMRFDDYLGRFVYHCHIPFHEDHGMMGVIEVVPEKPTYAVGANPGELPRVRVVDPMTDAVTADFLAFNAGYRGGVNVATADVNGDGVYDVIIGKTQGSPHVRVIDGTKLHLIDPRTRVVLPSALLGDFLAFTPGVRGVNVAAGHFNGDQRADIVAGAGNGPTVRIIDAARLNEVGRRRTIHPDALIHELAVFTGRARGGVRVAAADVDFNGRTDLIVGAGRGSDPLVRIFGGPDLEPLDEFLAYEATQRGGVFVAAGDVKGFGYPDIVTGAGIGSAPLVKVFSKDDGGSNHHGGGMASGSVFEETDSFLAYDNHERRGATVTTVLDPRVLPQYGSSRFNIATSHAAGKAWPSKIFARAVKSADDHSDMESGHHDMPAH